MNRALDEIQYRSRSAPLEKRLTFNDLQARNVGFQTPIPVDTTLEKMASLEFKNMEGQMFEAASFASGAIRNQKQTEVMVDQAAALNEIPRTAAAAMAQPEGRTLPPEFQFGTAAPLHAADAARAQRQRAFDEQQSPNVPARHSALDMIWECCSRYRHAT